MHQRKPWLLRRSSRSKRQGRAVSTEPTVGSSAAAHVCVTFASILSGLASCKCMQPRARLQQSRAAAAAVVRWRASVTPWKPTRERVSTKAFAVPLWSGVSLQQRMQKRLIRKQQRAEQQREHLGTAACAAILDLIYDPHSLAEKLFGVPT